jgi:hypothetical protein
MATINARSLNKLSIASTLVDAAMAFYRGRYKRGAMLLGAAVISSRVPGFGTAASILSRLFDRVQRGKLPAP